MKKVILTFFMMASFGGSYAQQAVPNSAGKVFMYPNKECKPRQFKKIIMYSGLTDATIDDKILEEIKGTGVSAVSALLLMPPVKTYSSDEVNKIYTDNEIEGAVTLTQTNQYQNQREFNLTLYDFNNQKSVVVFIGYAFNGVYSAPGKTSLKFVTLVKESLKPYLWGTNQ